jgi:hypothetical protein
MRPTHCFALLGSLALTTAAFAQDREFAFGAGYGHLLLDGSNVGDLDEQGGLNLNGRISWPVTPSHGERRPELRFGVGVGLGFYAENDDQNNDDEFFDEEEIEVTQLTVISNELQLSYRQPVGREFYLEPGVAGQFLVGNFWAGDKTWLGGFWWDVDEEEDIWRVGGGGRLFLRAAYQQDRWSAGVEGSYSYGYLDFGDGIGGDIQQAYIGVFFAHSF